MRNHLSPSETNSSIFGAAIIGGAICFSLRGLLTISGGAAFALGFVVTYLSLLAYAGVKSVTLKLDLMAQLLKETCESRTRTALGEESSESQRRESMWGQPSQGKISSKSDG
jgi:hypothetical protein